MLAPWSQSAPGRTLTSTSAFCSSGWHLRSRIQLEEDTDTAACRLAGDLPPVSQYWLQLCWIGTDLIASVIHRNEELPLPVPGRLCMPVAEHQRADGQRMAYAIHAGERSQA